MEITPYQPVQFLGSTTAYLRDRLSFVARFVKARDGGFVPEHPPVWCVKAIYARGHWPGIRPLTGIIENSVLRSDGTVLDTPGYDKQSGLLFKPSGPIPKIPANPTLEDARRSAELLLDLVDDFPSAKSEHRAVWLAGVLTPLARHTFEGPSPLFLIDANVRGSGKSLLADVISLIATGREMARMPNPRDDDEFRKRITSLVVFGDQLALVDNIVGSLGCASLDAALTGTVWKDRILGKTEIIEMPLKLTWFATGNNVVLLADTSRRTCHIRLNSPLEIPPICGTRWQTPKHPARQNLTADG